MGVRYSKRIGGNQGFGLNLSGSGISSSYRTKYGTIGSKGFSIRSGIPGLSFRSGYGRGKNKGMTAIILLGLIVFAFVLYYSAIVIYNLALFLWWALVETRKLILRIFYKWKENKEIKNSTKEVFNE